MNKLAIANLKMNHTYDEIKKYKETISSYITDNLIICPSFIHLDIMRSDDYILGAQDGFYVDKGAYTGQVSFYQLKDLGVKYCIMGHSEFRKLYDDDSEKINRKLKACLKNDIIPIVCVGESVEQKNNGETLNVIGKDLRIILDGVDVKNIIIAYEPIWAIGSGMIPSKIEIEEVHMYIKKVLKDIYDIDASVMYGGSVNEQNITDIIDINGVDGVLIGTACKDPNQLMQVLNKMNM